MIRIHVFDVAGRSQRMYENLAPVGAVLGDNNNRDKANNQLVQFFLRAFFRKRPELLPAGPLRSKGFLLDGKVGKQTVEGIRTFQEVARRAGTPLFVDSRVSVAAGINVPGTGFRWTIHALNSFYILRSGNTDFDTLFENREI